jgi:putative peptidoglycan lipid II flippase
VNTAHVMRSSAVMAAGTAVSRVLGFVKAAILLAAVSPGASADTFSVANTVPNALYILLAGGILNAVLVPQITRAARQADGGQQYIDRLLTMAVSMLFVVTTAVTIAAPFLIQLYATDKWSDTQVALGTAFALWCLPQVFWYGLYTLLGQVLNARGSFGPFMWAPVVNNLVGIAGLLWFISVAGTGDRPISEWSPGTIALLSGMATLGVVAQALILIPALRRTGVTYTPRWGMRGFGLRTASRVAAWTFAAVLAQQVGFVIISRVTTAGQKLASDAHATGTIGTGKAIYDNAFLLFMLPHSLVAVSLVTALFTRMSVSAADDRIDDVRSDLSLGLRVTGLATVISATAFLALGTDITRALFAGNNEADTRGLAYVTMAMMIGLVPFSAQYLFQRVFYAFEDAKTPFLVQVPIVVTWSIGNLLSLWLLAGHPEWIVVGVGVSMAIANTLGAGLSAFLLHKRLGSIDGRRIIRTHVRLVMAAAVAGVCAWLSSVAIHGVAGEGKMAAMTATVVGGLVLLGVYGVMLRLLRVTELEEALLPLVRRRRVASSAPRRGAHTA